MVERTLPQLFEESVQKFPDNVLMWEKKDGKYQGITYREMRTRVRDFAAGLLTLGLRKGDRVTLLSEGRADWLMSELGILYTGAINVPISVKIDEPNELKFRLSHSGSRMAIVSRGQLPKLRAVKNDLPELERIIVLDPVDSLEEGIALAAETIDSGRALSTLHALIAVSNQAEVIAG